jgi:hypothetical protein
MSVSGVESRPGRVAGREDGGSGAVARARDGVSS